MLLASRLRRPYRDAASCRLPAVTQCLIGARVGCTSTTSTPGFENVRPHRGVRTERYEYIHFFLEPQEYELYDLQADPDEDHNLHGKLAHEVMISPPRPAG